MRQINRVAVALGLSAAFMAAGCQELDVTNTNNPDRDRALSEAGAVEALLANSFPQYFTRMFRVQFTSDALPFLAPVVGDETTSTQWIDARCNPVLELASTPRAPLNNDPTSCATQWPYRIWLDFYRIHSNANDALKAINENKLAITTPNLPGETNLQNNTYRSVNWARLWQGISLAMLGVSIDRAWIVDETNTDDEINQAKLPLSPYRDVVEAGLQKLELAAQLAKNAPAPYTIPGAWLFSPTNLTNTQVAQIANSLAARFYILSARTPQERQNLDWQRVLRYLDNGVTSDVLMQLGSSAEGRQAEAFNYYQRTTSVRMHADYKAIGWADVSGRFQAWLATPPDQRTKFDITTPDRRITGAAGPTTNGTYFKYIAAEPFDAAAGGYFLSSYQWNRRAGNFNSGTWPFISKVEMDLYRAEARLRTGNAAGAAALISLTRVANGQLPAVTAAGVPESPTCVPKTATGACGTLLDALQYERLIEMFAADPMRTYLDRRGFGTLEQGTLLHLPVPGTQLEILGIPRYTFGGAVVQ